MLVVARKEECWPNETSVQMAVWSFNTSNSCHCLHRYTLPMGERGGGEGEGGEGGMKAKVEERGLNRSIRIGEWVRDRMKKEGKEKEEEEEDKEED